MKVPKKSLLAGLLLASLLPAQATPAQWAVSAPVAAVLKAPKVGTEQVTQALLGDEVQVLGTRGPWTHVRVVDQSYKHLGYPGWILQKDLAIAPVGGAVRLVQSAHAELYGMPRPGLKPVTLAFLGSKLHVAPALDQPKGWTAVSIPGAKAPLWAHDGDLADPQARPVQDRTRMVSLARELLGTHYLWGGMSQRGIDCSGLTYTTYRTCGVAIPRDADQQFAVGTPVDKKDMQVGDLMFFGNKPGEITHVGMFIGDGKFIQASGHLHGVCITPIDDPYYVPIFQGARRF